MAIDVCDRLWFVDTSWAHVLGEGGPTGARDVYSKPTLYIYDLNTDKLLKKYILNENVTTPDTFIANIVLLLPLIYQKMCSRIIISGFGCR